MKSSLILLSVISLVSARSRSFVVSKTSSGTGSPSWERNVPHRSLSLTASHSELPRGGGYDDYGNNDGGYGRDDPYGDPNDDRYNNDRYNNDDGYNDDRGSYGWRQDDGGGRSGFAVPSIIKTGNRKIGLPLLATGGVLTVFGVTLFFNKALMRLGNLFFVAGVPMTIGLGRTAGYFLQPKKARATACLALGIFLVFLGRPVLGIILEAFGLLNLFGNMFPIVLAMLKTMPVIGPLLRGNGSNRNRRRSNDEWQDNDDRDSYYDDRGYYNDERKDDRYDDNNNNNGFY